MRLRKLFTDNEVLEAVQTATKDGCISYSYMAAVLNDYDRGDVTRQLARYWARQFEQTKKNGEFYLTLAKANRAEREAREARKPSPQDQQAKVDQGTDFSRILFLSDTHAPYHHPDLIEFLKSMKDRFKPTSIIHGGDEIDQHALSFHDSDPNLLSAGQELEQARMFVQELHELFPVMRICDSNHGSLHYRRAKAHGIPVEYLRTYREVLFPDGGGEGWSWHSVIRVDQEDGRPLQFQHQAAGDLMKAAAHEGANLYVGHEHSKYGIGYGANAVSTYHSVYGGCTLDPASLAFAYGKLMISKPVLGITVVLGGRPCLIPMQLDKHGRWVGK
jgi:hypothetical protein